MLRCVFAINNSKFATRFHLGITGAALEISACGFRFTIQGPLTGGLNEFRNREPQNCAGSAETMDGPHSNVGPE